MTLKNIAACGLLALSLASCTSSKTVLPYFTDITEVKEGELPSDAYMPTIQPDDELYISVNSADPQASALYNLPNYNPATRETIKANGQTRSATYIVSDKGDINMPVLGKIHVQGMTTEALAALIAGKVSKEVKNPSVQVKLVNFKVTVAGEVAEPKSIYVDRNRITLLDALAQAGDLTPYGERTNVLVIREENGKRTYAHLDLNSSDVLTSPYYYLQQNDYVYVAPNKIRQSNSKYNQDNAYKLSVISTVVSAASVIASLVIALSIK